MAAKMNVYEAANASGHGEVVNQVVNQEHPTVVVFIDGHGRVVECWANAASNVLVLTASPEPGETSVEAHGQRWAVDARRLGRLRDTPHVVRPRAVQGILDSMVQQMDSPVATGRPAAQNQEAAHV